MKKIITIALLLSGCSFVPAYQSSAGGIIGCPANEIKITDQLVRFDGNSEYTAECRGHTFYCTWTGIEPTAPLTKCTEALSAK